jgi:NAD(P)-dependent dehydrogenase (short-subunit alcohol dehydrogenase family)
MTSEASACPPRALITGAAKRIGRAIALDLASAGYAVALHYNQSAADAEALAAEITANGGQAVSLRADLTCEDEVQALVPHAVAALGGPLGLLVNNASLFEYDSAQSTTRQSWDRHMEANLRAPFVLCQQMAAALEASPEAKGCIINLIDQRVWNLTPHFTSYTLSKAGLWTLTQTLALAFAPRIRVNAIGPGPALPSSRQTAADFAAQEARMPLRHGTDPQEIAQAVRFLVASRAMTGQMLALDGGQHLCWAPPSDEDQTAVE